MNDNGKMKKTINYRIHEQFSKKNYKNIATNIVKFTNGFSDV